MTSLLRNSLLANASFSVITGLCSLFLANNINQLFGLSTPIIFIVLGIGLILFSSFVFLTAFIKRSSWVLFIISQDLLWVIGSILILLLHPFGITAIGHQIILIVAAIVSVFALAQYIGFKKS